MFVFRLAKDPKPVYPAAENTPPTIGIVYFSKTLRSKSVYTRDSDFLLSSYLLRYSLRKYQRYLVPNFRIG